MMFYSEGSGPDRDERVYGELKVNQPRKQKTDSVNIFRYFSKPEEWQIRNLKKNLNFDETSWH